MNEIKFLNAFNLILGIGPLALRNLKNHFGSWAKAWEVPESNLAQAGISEKNLKAISWKRPSINPDREMEKLIKAGIWIITEEDQHFPEDLKEIPQPPLFLYGKGNVKILKERNKIGVIGSRKPTTYGTEATESLVKNLVAAGCTIVSGLALGIDSHGHRVCLEEKGKTIAVLGSGLDNNSIYPNENLNLAQKIAENNGVVISEYPIGTPPLKEHFPQRNRIISGISLGICVIEARAEKSGALLTARLALEQNREVFAVPGSIFSLTSVGPNSLIQQGAKLVMSGKDILEELGIEYTEEQSRKNILLGENEKLLIDLLEEPLTVDFLKIKTGLDTSSILTSLSWLELRGMIRNLGPDTYQKIN